MDNETKYPWYILDIIIFIFINGVLLWQIGGRLSEMHISWVHIAAAGLAVFRAANMISNEVVTKPLREPFVNIEHKHGKDVEVPKPRGFYGAMGSLIYCPSCTGTWIAMALFYAYVYWPGLTSAIIVILALSGLERLLTSTYNLLKK